MLGSGSAAAASQGSVPAEVAAYASDPDGLLASLDDLAGIGRNGQGIDFEGAKVGQLNRIFDFTPAFAAGEQTETPVQRANEWTAPISLGDKPLGVAVIWIDQFTIKPDIADFTEGATVGAALMDVPADAALVRDPQRGAWFALVGEELTPLVPGTSGVDGPVPLAEYQDVLAVPPVSAPAPAVALEPSIVVIVVSILVILTVLLVPTMRERKAAKPDAAVAPVAVEAAPAAPTPPINEAGAKQAITATRKPAAKVPAAKTPAAKPVTTKAATAKVSTAKPATAKARATKPATAKAKPAAGATNSAAKRTPEAPPAE